MSRLTYVLYDIALIIGGLVAAYLGVPALSEFYEPGITALGSIALSIFALAALLGLLIKKLWWLEIAGKSAIVGWFVIYILALFTLAAGGDDARGFVVVLGFIAALIARDRLAKVSADRRKRKRIKRMTEEMREAAR